MNGHAEADLSASCDHVFDQFVTAVTCKAILTSFNQLLDLTGLRHASHTQFYEKLKSKLKGSWKAQNLWAKLDKRAAHRDYKKGQACSNMRVLIIGSGPCGLRTAIECALLGAKTVIVEKRDRFSRNNVLHLWPYLITDLRNLGAKKFFGKFCAGAIDHISIRQLQCILLKVALLLGVEVHVNVTFEGLIDPPEDQSSGVGWKCKVTPENHALSEYEFDALIGADGKRNTLPGFRRKEFRGKLAIAVTANFINRNSHAEARVQEISGVAFIFNQKFFMDLKESTRIDLENIVYYKDDTHYFVMTAKKASLLEKGVLKEDYSDTLALLDRSNVDQERLLAFAREAADFSTNYQLPSLDYAVNHYGQADVAMFDFTSMFAAENASRFIMKNGHHLLMGLVGDSLLEPFWPTGSGCARGFLSAFDAAWMIRNWAMGKSPLQVLAERESIYTVLSQTTPNYLNKNHNMFSLDPNTRYPNLNTRLVKPSMVRHLYEGGVFDTKELEEEDLAVTVPAKRPRTADVSSIDSYSLLRWCQRVLNTGKYRDVHVVDFTSSWRSGLALCALIHSFRPELINNTMLMECDVAANNQMAFNIAEKELGIPPVLTGEDMAKYDVPDKLTMVSYLAQFHELFKLQPLPTSMPLPVKAKRKSMSKETTQPKVPHSPNKRVPLFQKLTAKLGRSKKRKEEDENERSILGSKKLKEREKKSEAELVGYSKLPMGEIANRLQLDRKIEIKVNKMEERSGAVSVTAMADLLVAKFKSNESKPPPEPIKKLRGQPSLLAASSASEFCSFCHKRVYIMERMSAEGEFFHRSCLRCDHCGVGLRLTNYSCDRDTKPVKFYCYRHAIPELRTRTQRKRVLDEENVPDVVITPPLDVEKGQTPKEKTPKKAPGSQLTPLLIIPKDTSEQNENTPERIEFEISFDGQEEESEEEQFEHNLRASLSSDTLLDDDDSDSELSDSDMESDAEDEVWENAVESFKSPRTPLTLEEACELRGNWRRHHSLENLVADQGEDRTPSRGPEYSRLFGDNCDDEESSTEVDEGSEYETDVSSEEDDSSEEEKTEPLQGVSADEHTEKSLKSPISPVSRLSASKASFFSEPPKVVSLDPWSMFGMVNKTDETETGSTKSVDKVKHTSKKSSSSSRKKSSCSESKSVSERRKSTESKKDLSSKDTDVSESLEFDVKAADVSGHKGETVSPAGSLDELKEDFNLEHMDEEQPNLDVNNSEITADRIQSSIQNESESLEVNEPDKSVYTDAENSDVLADVDADELLEKAALSRAMEELLQSSDQKSSSIDSSDEVGTESSESEDKEEMFLEGHLDPATEGRTKRFVKHVSHTKEWEKSHSSTESDSEDERVEPTSTGSSQPQGKSGNDPTHVGLSPKSSQSGEAIADADDQNFVNTGDVKIETEQDDVSLQKVLESVAAMPDLSENSDIDDLVFSNIDDKFVTDRRTKSRKQTDVAVKASAKSDPGLNASENTQMNNMLSKLVSSDSESSLSSVPEDKLQGQVLEIESGDDDIKPDQLLLDDYTTTLSLALGESYSDEVEEKLVEENKSPDVSLQEYESIAEKVLLDAEIENKSPDVDLQEYESIAEKVLLDAEIENKSPDVDLQEYESIAEKVLLDAEIEENKSPDVSLEKYENIAEKVLPETEVECNSNRHEPNGINDFEAAADNSSLYMTPDASLEKQDEVADIRSIKGPISVTQKLPLPQSQVPVPRPRKSKDSKVSKSNKLQAMPGDLTPPRVADSESSGSDFFLSPVDNTLISPLAEVTTVSPPSEDSLPCTDTSKSIISPSPPSTTQPSNSAQVTSTSEAAKSRRKLPGLPKLNIPTKEPIEISQTEITVDQPIMCSSPKLGKQATPRTISSHFSQQSCPPISPRKAQTTATTNTKSSSINAKNSVAVKQVSSPALNPPKVKVPIDKGRLKLGSSSDHLESDHEADTKKRISAEGIVIQRMFDDDIPFADESEAEEKFYTPCAPEKTVRPTFTTSLSSASSKTVLGSPPVLQDDDTDSNAQKANKSPLGVGKLRIKAGERLTSKTAEKPRVNVASSVHNSATAVPTQQAPVRSVHERDKRNISYDTNSTSDVLSESDDNRVQTATSSTTECDQKSRSDKSKSKKTKVNSQTDRKEQNKTTEKKLLARDKRKTLVASTDPPKTVDNKTVDRKTPKGSDEHLGNVCGYTKSNINPASDKKILISKAKFDSSSEDVSKTPESKRDLAICSVFHSEASNRQSRGLLNLSPSKRAVPVAAKHSADELSDSDESHISLSTMQRRREEDLDERVARRLRKIQLKQQKRAEQKRLRMAQEIQRQLEEVEVRQRELEERGITVEKALRGDSPDGEDVDEGQLMSEWFSLVHEKNALVRYESELNVRARELELEDRQARLEMDFRERSKQPEEKKTDSDIAAEGRLLDELLEVVEQRNNLVAMLEEDRLREQKEDTDLKEIMTEKGFMLSPLSFDTRRTKIEAP
ncbi:hypothetical protein BsWGS_12701 [Bradybaena similaris]